MLKKAKHFTFLGHLGHFTCLSKVEAMGFNGTRAHVRWSSMKTYFNKAYYG
jgi:hypothetical protein